MPSRDAPTLARAFDTPEAKRRYTRRLFGTIAARYDLITRLLSFGQDQRWKRRVIELARIDGTSRVLDLACGTGDLAIAAAARGAWTIGLDFAPPMIDVARRRALNVRWVVGDMNTLPFADGSADVVTTGYGIRNVPDLPGALAELHRVLKPGGRLVALDFDRPDPPAVRAVYLAYLTLVGSALGAILHRDPDTYRYIPASIRRYPGARAVAALMEAGGFRDVEHHRVLGGLMAIHSARRGPRIS